jgi:sporulation protein YlmC with PRC-barrel domain
MDFKDNLTRLTRVPVVAMEEGLRLGKVHDVYVDREAKRVQGISFKGPLWGKEGEAYVALSEILKIGIDVIIVSRQAAAVPLTDDMAKNSLRHLKGFKITTHDGAYIGEMADLNVNRENGLISEIILNGNQSLEVDIDEIVLGPDVIVVPPDYIDRIRPVEIEDSGLMARMFDPGAVTDSLRGKYAEIKASVRSAMDKGEMVETLRSGSEKTRRAVKRTSRKLQETLEQIRKKQASKGSMASGEDRGYQGTEAEHAGRTYHGAEYGDVSRQTEGEPHAGHVDSGATKEPPNI